MVIPFFQPLLWFLFWGRSACVMQDKLWPLSLPIAKERNIYNIFFLMAVYIQIGCLCIYWAACLQTMWLSGCQHHHSLPRIDPPTARLLSALSCRIDVLSNDFHTHYAQIFVLLSARMHRHFENCSHSTFSTYKLIFNSKTLTGTSFCHSLCYSTHLPPLGWYRAA